MSSISVAGEPALLPRRRPVRSGSAGEEILDAYVELELELADEDPAATYPGTAIHLRSCPGCRADHDGLLEAARRFSDADPD